MYETTQSILFKQECKPREAQTHLFAFASLPTSTSCVVCQELPLKQRLTGRYHHLEQQPINNILFPQIFGLYLSSKDQNLIQIIQAFYYLGIIQASPLYCLVAKTLLRIADEHMAYLPFYRGAPQKMNSWRSHEKPKESRELRRSTPSDAFHFSIFVLWRLLLLPQNGCRKVQDKVGKTLPSQTGKRNQLSMTPFLGNKDIYSGSFPSKRFVCFVMFLILSHLLAYLYLVFGKELDIYIMSNITQPKQLHPLPASLPGSGRASVRIKLNPGLTFAFGRKIKQKK